MILNIVLIVVIVISFGVILFVWLRKFPKVKTLDVSTVPAARKAEVRDRILMERMKRSSRKSKEAVRKGASPLFKGLGGMVKKLFKKVYDLETKYKKEAETKHPLKAGELKQKVKNLLKEAHKLAKDEKYQEAEKIYIEIISLDPRNQDTYKGLTDLYIEMKEYEQALQTAEFILKLEKKNSKEVERTSETGEKYRTVSNANDLACAYSDIGYLYEMIGDKDKSAESYNKALDLEPNNPKNITQMMAVYIDQKKKSKALELLAHLEKINPQNQKLSEYRDSITAI